MLLSVALGAVTTYPLTHILPGAVLKGCAGKSHQLLCLIAHHISGANTSHSVQRNCHVSLQQYVQIVLI